MRRGRSLAAGAPGAGAARGHPSGAGARQAGITLIELLIGMAILGIIMTVAAMLFSTTGRVTNQQDRQVDAAASARLALFRMGEIVRQANYVYPPGTTISIPGHGSFTTGTDALAVLVPAGTTYCAGTASVYCGFLYGIVNRNAFVPPLRDSGATNEALVEFRVEGIDWPKDAVPALTITGWPSGGNVGLISDGLDRAGTNLGGNVFVSPLEAIYDDVTNFSLDPNVITLNSLVNGVDVVVNLRRSSVLGATGAQQRVEVYTRAVPRSAPPNLQN